MQRQDLGDLAIFEMIAREGNFGRAARRLGFSSSAVSHALRGLEARLGLKLLHRTTRSVSLTEAGTRVLTRLRPALAEIEASVQQLHALRDTPSGHVKISAHHNAATLTIAPKLAMLRRHHPGISVELVVEDDLVDIVAKGFDAGVRPGERIDQDMVAVPIGPDRRSAVVASPGYLAHAPAPALPDELGGHACIAFRQVSSGALYRWAFEKAGRTVSVAVDPVFVTTSPDLLVTAALDGIGLSYVLRDQAAPHLASGALVEILADWSTTVFRDFLYYPSRQQPSPALRAVVEALRWTGARKTPQRPSGSG